MRLLGVCVLVIVVAAPVWAGRQGQAVKILEQWQRQNTGNMKPKAKVIRSAEDWQQTWKAAHARTFPSPEIPQIDFNTHMVLAAYSGAKRTGGYAIEFTDVRVADGTLRAYIHEETPGKKIKSQNITSPACFAVVPRIDMKVEFIKSKE